MNKNAQKTTPALQTKPSWLNRQLLLPLAALALLILFSYWPAIYPATIWDDADYLTFSEPIRRLNGIWDIWFKPSTTAHYFPMLYTAHWLEYRLWGMNIAAFHAMNILYHIIAAGLLWHILKKLRVPFAWLATAIWAIHPMQVETVAWISERKNILGSVFFFLSILTYMSMRDAAPRKRIALYVGTILAMIAAILSKQVMIVLPAVLFLIDLWRDQRIVLSRLKLIAPLLIPAALIAAIGVYQERHFVGTLGPDFDFTLDQRFAIAGRSLFFYVEKFLFPWPLLALYPRFDLHTIIVPGIALFVFAMIFIAALWMLRSKLGLGPVVLAALYVVLISPALGFISYFTQLYTFVTDHYAHLAIGALTIALAFAFSRIRTAVLRQILAAVILLSCVVLSCSQSFLYRSELELWRYTYRHNPDSWIVMGNYAAALAMDIQNRNPRATYQDCLEPLALYEKSANLFPDWRTYNNMGLLYMGVGRMDDAIRSFEKVDQLKPESVYRMEERQAATRMPPYQFYLAATFERQGKIDDAIKWYRKATEKDPNAIPIWLSLGNLLISKERFQDALAVYDDATKAIPQSAELWFNYGILLRQIGRNDEGIKALMRAHDIDPNVINKMSQTPSPSRGGAQTTDRAK